MGPHPKENKQKKRVDLAQQWVYLAEQWCNISCLGRALVNSGPTTICPAICTVRPTSGPPTAHVHMLWPYESHLGGTQLPITFVRAIRPTPPYCTAHHVYGPHTMACTSSNLGCYCRYPLGPRTQPNLPISFVYFLLAANMAPKKSNTKGRYNVLIWVNGHL